MSSLLSLNHSHALEAALILARDSGRIEIETLYSSEVLKVKRDAYAIRLSGLKPYSLKTTHWAIELSDKDIREVLGEE